MTYAPINTVELTCIISQENFHADSGKQLFARLIITIHYSLSTLYYSLFTAFRELTSPFFLC